MSTGPLVSVIMPAYNAGLYIRESIRSIITQTYGNWELIIVDDGSKDQTWGIISEFKDSRIKAIRCDENRGYPFAMNIGIAESRGKYIARMDADDVSAPERLIQQVGVLEGAEDYSFVGCIPFFLTPSGVKIFPPARQEQIIVENWFDLVNHRRLFADPSVMIEKALVLQVGGYRTYQRTGQDVDLWLRVLEMGKPMATLTTPLYGRRLQPDSLYYSASAKFLNHVPRIEAYKRVGMKVPSELLENLPDQSRVACWKLQWLLKLSAFSIEVGDIRGGYNFLYKALHSQMLCSKYMKYLLLGVLQIGLASFRRFFRKQNLTEIALRYHLF